MNLKTLTGAELHQLQADILTEWERRRASTVTDQAVTEVITGLQDAGKLSPPPAGEDVETAQPWADPGTDHSRMYLLGDRVSHGGRVWTSRVNGLNSWEPGAPGVYSNVWGADPDPEPDPAPETPTNGENEGTTTPGDSVPVTEFKPGEQVKVGDRRAWQGHIWEVVQAHRTQEDWAPDQEPALWKRVD